MKSIQDINLHKGLNMNLFLLDIFKTLQITNIKLVSSLHDKHDGDR